MNYRHIVVTKRGGIDGMHIEESELRPAAPGEARVKVLAVPVCQDDIAARLGNRPTLPDLPFTPGYAIYGVVEQSGEGVERVQPCDHVVALTQLGGYAETIYLKQELLVKAPSDLDAGEIVTLILNYLVAYQILHRVAEVKSGDRVLIGGASGGVGTAFLQLGSLAGLKMYGLASGSKHEMLRQYGAVPIDYHEVDFVEEMKRLEPQGIDFVFNGMAEDYFEPGRAVLRRGGVLVHYGGPRSFMNLLLLIAKLVFYNILPDGKKIKGYGTHRLGVELFEVDWNILFEMLADRRIQPIIAARMPILEAIEANHMLESGQVSGNIVLLSPELLDKHESG